MVPVNPESFSKPLQVDTNDPGTSIKGYLSLLLCKLCTSTYIMLSHIC
uniref:Uncharacterized protein n=1 Tax=Amphimedon queenslandica TaxID=400682 RepID=A0A1X7VD95_AMPQE